MRVVVPREVVAGERRVALVPEGVSRLLSAAPGLEVAVEAGAGVGAGFPDTAYRDAGAVVEAATDALWASADVVLKVQPPTPEEAARLNPGATLIALLSPLTEPDLVQALAGRRVSAFALELVPRITRAQKMDVLSSQASAAGYKAVLLAANLSPRFFPMLMTAAGTIAPARVLVLGAGVAGLQAIATARRLGAVVEAYDIRPAAKEQVESLGARFVGDALEGAETAGGYAREVGTDVQKKQHALLARHVAEADVVVTTAQVPGRRAPLLVTGEMVAAMRPGSVVVDLAGDSGGNCEWTVPGETIERGGVTVAGPLNLPATLPFHASQMFTRNVSAVLTHLLHDGAVAVDLEDEITAACCVTHEGEIVNERVREAVGNVGAIS